MASKLGISHSGVGHRADMGGRISLVGLSPGSISENVAYMHTVTGADPILQFIIDDGVPSRGHRRNCYSSVSLVGIGLAKGRNNAWYMCMDFSGMGYRPYLSLIHI